MAGKTDKTKLASAILSVGNARMSGVQHGATVNPEKAEDQGRQGLPVPQAEGGPGQGALEAARQPEQATIAAPPTADAKTERIAFLCTPKVKKHLKRLAIDLDMDVSKLILEALAAKGYLPLD
ncbi:MAG: hypothetical protein ORO03_10730 [Alphaproteobacteria bacterium]|nr:hypothetical protein [Alphaproteobacteria bacterium]